MILCEYVSVSICGVSVSDTYSKRVCLHAYLKYLGFIDVALYDKILSPITFNATNRNHLRGI